MKYFLPLFLFLLLLLSCKNSEIPPKMEDELPAETTVAQITDVSVSGSTNAYSFSVGIKSPDTGCDQYADWWEVITLDSVLLYRRILTHSHVSEQPFTRTGGPVPIQEDTQVLIRAHMNNLGYGTQAFSGTVSAGFSQIELSPTFATQLETAEPLPDSCAF